MRSDGVGGNSGLYIIDSNGEVKHPSENNSKLAEQIARGVKRNLLPPKFAREALRTLLYQNEDYKIVESKM